MKTIGVIEVLTVLFIILIFGLIGFNIYGHTTQHDTITVKIINKEVVTTTTSSCTTIGEIRTCTPIINTTYHVYSSNEDFTISQKLYNKVIVGKKHTFYVTGWKHMRNIGKVLE